MTQLATESTRRPSPRIEPHTSGGGAAAGARPLIMLATSGSPSSLKATVFAAELAAASSAALRIVHVVAPVQYRYGRLAPTRAVQHKLRDPFASSVLRHARELAWRHSAAATVQLFAGEPPQAIVAAVAHAHANLLVIGAHNHNRVFGRTTSTRRWIHAHAPCQVVTPTGAEAAWPQLSPGRWLQH